MIAGLRFDIHGLGLIGELMQHSATVGGGLRELVLHLHLHDRGATPVLMGLDAGTMLLGYSVYRFGTPSLDLVYDTSTGILLRVLEALCGPDFRAKAVQVTTQGRSRSASYRWHFGCSVRFNSSVSGVVFASQWMDRPVAGADPSRRGELQQSLAQAEASSPMTFGQRVEIVTQQMLLSGTATGPAIALIFGMSERSLRRQLAREGLSLRGLLNRTRFALACQMLQYTKLSVAAVAMALQYRDANAFSRAFRSWAGFTALEWRAKSVGQA
jgi:AraC-like DNA-binding protein